jgi:hypothetical protein
MNKNHRDVFSRNCLRFMRGSFMNVRFSAMSRYSAADITS